MKRIIDGPGAGKTSRLLLLAKENGGIVVCKDPLRIRERALNYGLTGIYYVSYEDFSFTQYYNKPVFIDDLEDFLKHKNKDIAGYCLNKE